MRKRDAAAKERPRHVRPIHSLISFRNITEYVKASNAQDKGGYAILGMPDPACDPMRYRGTSLYASKGGRSLPRALSLHRYLSISIYIALFPSLPLSLPPHPHPLYFDGSHMSGAVLRKSVRLQSIQVQQPRILPYPSALKAEPNRVMGLTCRGRSFAHRLVYHSDQGSRTF